MHKDRNKMSDLQEISVSHQGKRKKIVFTPLALLSSLRAATPLTAVVLSPSDGVSPKVFRAFALNYASSQWFNLSELSN